MYRTLRRIRSDWDRFAEADPLWAVLTHPEKRGRRWDKCAFFETGRHEIDDLMHYIGTLGIEISHRRALDFGCGVGRLTGALAGHFDEVYGVDISPVMLDLARGYCAHLPNCTFVENTNPDLCHLLVKDFDLIYSCATLQHMPPRFAKRYLRCMAQRLRPGGLLVFQLPDRSLSSIAGRFLAILYEEIYRKHILRTGPSMDMHGIRKPKVISLLENNGCRVLDTVQNQYAGKEWICYRYAAVRY